MSIKLYHVTNRDNAKSIRKNGLVPQLGKNRKLCSEEGDEICLCRQTDVKYWIKLLGIKDPVVFSVDIVNLDISSLSEYFTYGLFGECRYQKPIPKEILTKQRTPKLLTREEEDELCLDYLETLHYLCRLFGKYYLSPRADGETKEDIRETIIRSVKPTLYSIKLLDYDGVDAAKLRAAIREYGDGSCPLTDRIFVSKKWWDDAGREMPKLCKTLSESNKKTPRLYQMLTKYGNDEFSALRKELYWFIVKTLRPKGCLDINTGKWWAI